MQFTIAKNAHGFYDAVLRFLPAGEAISFSDPLLQQAYTAAYSGDRLCLEHKQIRTLRMKLAEGYTTVLLAGFNSSCTAAYDDFRALTAAVGTALVKEKVETLLIDRMDGIHFAGEAELVCQLAATLPLCEYHFDRYLSSKSTVADHRVTLLTEESCADALQEGQVLAQSVMTARDLVNELAEILTPEELANRTVSLGQRGGFEVQVLDRRQCRELGMNLFLAVSRGSKLEPKFIVMRYRGGAENAAPIALVGKGITYDSGGYNIKSGSMESMRFDMNGSAAVIGAMCAIARRKLPVNVVAAVAACENMVDADAFRSGEVIRSMNGQTVFVRNTDAEGRLTMADAMTWCIRNEKPTELLEVAGLTGSVCNFFGSVCAAVLANDPAIFQRVSELMPITGEKYAAMPFFPEYRQQLSCPYADLNNAPLNAPGGILAGFFLESFSEGVPFMHIDFGAMPFTGRRSDGQPEGGTGFGVKTLYYYVKKRSGK